MRAEAAATTPAVTAATTLAATTPSCEASRGKRPAGSTPDHATRPPKRASRVVQYVVSSDEEGAEEPAVAETPSTQTTVREGPVEAENVAAPPSEGVNEQTIPASTSPRPASPSVAMASRMSP
ncbi:hypothetical protein LWI29_006728 [Acer saccharum]|uniref:Uncharacterized protein n=1 Tax=Acer saccharum TaxID=4024 RepID=A0AA39SLB3_ACESA|nr:hypothetical protein LWI29_006728 [Acer saccharum]